MYKGVGVRFADFMSFFFPEMSHENELIWSQRDIFVGYLKTGGGGVKRTPGPPLDPPQCQLGLHTVLF